MRPTGSGESEAPLSEQEVRQLLQNDDVTDLTINQNIPFTNDPEEAKWNYFREDPRLHIFHEIWHVVF